MSQLLQNAFHQKNAPKFDPGNQIYPTVHKNLNIKLPEGYLASSKLNVFSADSSYSVTL